MMGTWDLSLSLSLSRGQKLLYTCIYIGELCILVTYGVHTYGVSRVYCYRYIGVLCRGCT